MHSGEAFVLILEGTLNLLTVGSLKWVSHLNAFYITKTKPKVAFPAFSCRNHLLSFVGRKLDPGVLGRYTRSAPLLAGTQQLLFKI